MELQKNSFTLGRCVARGAREISADTDIIVPDIKPDILKILQISGNCLITRKEISDGKINVDGRIDFTVLYIPDTENGKITSISSFFDFSHVIADENIRSDCYAELSADLLRIDFQLINSRKLRIKSLSEISYEAGITETEEIAVNTDGNDCPEVQKKNIRLMSTIAKKQCDFSVHERVELPPGQTQINELLRTDIKIIDKEFKCISGRIVAKGSFDIHILYTDCDNALRFSDYQLPFTEIFEIEGTNDDTICDIEYTIGDISTKIGEDSDGDLRCIDLEILVFANITASEEIETEYICDCHCPGYETVLEKTEKKLDALCCRTQIQQTVRDIVSPQQGSPAMHGIYNVPAEISVAKTKVAADKTTVEGNLTCYVLYTSDSSENPICSIKKEIPFSVSIETLGSRDGMTCEICSEISHIGYSINSAGEAEIRAIISIAVKILETSYPVFIESAELVPLSENEKKGIVLYFVQPGDTIWSIAKHYHVSQEDIISLNNLDEECTIFEGMKMVIPMS